MKSILFAFGLFLAAVLLIPSVAHSQLNAALVNGDLGLESGTLPPPGLYWSNFYDIYMVDEIAKANGGDVGLRGGNVDEILYMTTLMGVLDYKILGGNFGASVTLPWAKSRLEFPSFDHKSSDWSYADMGVSPINLGWHLPYADITTYYGLIIPTGKFDSGSVANTGYDQWSNLFGLGTTLYADTAHHYHASVNAELSVQSEKLDDDGVRTGNILSLEGGLGTTQFKGLLTAGAAYYAQFKITDDEGITFPPVIEGKNRYFGIGPEVDLAVPLGKMFFAQLQGRYYWEMGNVSATQGNTFILNLILGMPKGGV